MFKMDAHRLILVKSKNVRFRLKSVIHIYCLIKIK